jgi:hypothetical protein
MAEGTGVSAPLSDAVCDLKRLDEELYRVAEVFFE